MHIQENLLFLNASHPKTRPLAVGAIGLQIGTIMVYRVVVDIFLSVSDFHYSAFHTQWFRIRMPMEFSNSEPA